MMQVQPMQAHGMKMGDDDGYGNPSVTQIACYLPTGFVSIVGDCNDNNENISPGADELCNGIDDNCDEQVDEEGAADAPVWYLDADGDGYGTTNISIFTCTQPSGYQSNNTDCDDQDNDIYPQSFLNIVMEKMITVMVQSMRTVPKMQNLGILTMMEMAMEMQRRYP